MTSFVRYLQCHAQGIGTEIDQERPVTGRNRQLIMVKDSGEAREVLI